MCTLENQKKIATGVCKTVVRIQGVLEWKKYWETLVQTITRTFLTVPILSLFYFLFRTCDTFYSLMNFFLPINDIDFNAFILLYNMLICKMCKKYFCVSTFNIGNIGIWIYNITRKEMCYSCSTHKCRIKNTLIS